MTRFQVIKKLKIIASKGSITGLQIRNHIRHHLPVACTVVTLVVAGTANFNVGQAQAAGIVFDNGEPNLNDGIGITNWVEADDFVFSNDTLLTGVNFWTLEAPSKISDGALEYFIFENAAGQPGSLIASGDGVNVTKKSTGRDLDGYNEYAYSFDLLNPVSVLANVGYFLGLNWFSRYEPNYVYWETTSTDFGSPSHSSYLGTFDNWSNNGKKYQLAFKLKGDTQPVPEPITILGTLAAAGIGAALRRKSKRQAKETVEV
jgi:hypothetical protein